MHGIAVLCNNRAARMGLDPVLSSLAISYDSHFNQTLSLAYRVSTNESERSIPLWYVDLYGGRL
jgi:hypothetical protein